MTPIAFFDFLLPRRLARAATAFALGFTVSQSQTAELGTQMYELRERGTLRCGVDTGLQGFARQDEEGNWSGFEVDLCRAYAAAFLGDADRVDLVPLTTQARLDALGEGEVDILLRNTTWTLSRDAIERFTFAGVYYYDGQGFLVPRDLAITSARELDGARICVMRDTTTALNLADYAATHELTFQLVEVDTVRDGINAYDRGECDALSNDLSGLAGMRMTLEEPELHVILPDVISKEPLSAVVASRDEKFADAVRWVLHAVVAAEEYGVTGANASELAETSTSAEVRRLLGAEGALAEGLFLDAQFALRAIEAGGNYGEMFERNLGVSSGLSLRRGINAQWNEGGLMYAPPFR
ncbi:MAG: ABC-type L-amino acid uptake system substrate-binding component AapJ [Oceanicaulis sp. HLUCCA04]|nr:MAG: ABC-type L-amino acid uptake system substrate-binding component AapJ [Oceanicaulis sp. HLUCCA04]